MNWSFINSGACAAKFNMDFDCWLAESLQADIILPTLRLYGWNPPAISIGYHQQENDFDRTKLSDHGIDLVRRPTGGRAILHDHEVTYSVVMRIEDRSLRSIYRLINESIQHGLQLLGIHAELSGGVKDFHAAVSDSASAPCFSVSAPSELQVDGRKIVGSAQRRFGDVVLQHGSILLGPQHRRLVDYLAPSFSSSVPMMSETLQANTIDMDTILGRAIGFDEVAEVLYRGFATVLDAEFVPSEENLQLTPA